MKTCTKCHTELLLSEFYADKRGRDGCRGECRTCFAARSVAYYAANPEKRAAYAAKRRAAHREELRARAAIYNAAHRKEAAAYYAAHREEIAADKLQRTYGLTLIERAAMFEEQGGLCACGCGLPATHIDHCHECEDIDRRGSVRGLLCQLCNSYLDHIARVSQAHAAYLAAHAAACPAHAGYVAA